MKPRILIADDEEAIRDLLETYFSRHGYEVESVGSAQETMDAVAARVPACVVLDIALGDADGLEALGLLKNRFPEVPVVLLTGMGFDEELLQEAKEKGADGYVSKTLPLDQLLMAVVRALKYRRG